MSDSPPSPTPNNSRTQLIIVGGGDESGGSSGGGGGMEDESPSGAQSSQPMTYRVVSASEDAVIASPVNGGQFYVIGNPSEVIGSGGRALAPRSGDGGTSSSSSSSQRDDRRRATHNEVERRRRDMINTWIMKLARLIPDSGHSSGKSNQSKGGILAKACEYLQSTKNQNLKFEETRKKNEMLLRENERLSNSIAELKKENLSLRRQLESNGLRPDTIKFEL